MRKLLGVLAALFGTVGLCRLVKVSWLSWEHIDMTRREIFVEYPWHHIVMIVCLALPAFSFNLWCPEDKPKETKRNGK